MSGKIAGKNILYYRNLLGIWNQDSIFKEISKWRIAGNKIAGFHPAPVTPFQVLRYGERFFLGGRAQNTQQHLAAHVPGVNALFFKFHRHAKLLEFSHGLKAVEGISCKPGDGFNKDTVYFPSTAVGKQALKIVPLVGCGAGNRFVSIKAGKLPFVFGLDEVGVISYLGGKGIQLVG